MGKQTRPGVPPSVRRGGPRGGRPDPGPSRPLRVLAAQDPDNRLFIAIHEASHAVSAIVLGIPLRKVDLVQRRLPDGRISVGKTSTEPVSYQQIAGIGQGVVPHLIQCFTGPIGELTINPFMRDKGVMDMDREDAYRLASVAFCTPTDLGRDDGFSFSPAELARHQDEMDAALHAGAEGARELVMRYWPAIKEVASRLLELESLSGEKVSEIVRTTPTNVVDR